MNATTTLSPGAALVIDANEPPTSNDPFSTTFARASAAMKDAEKGSQLVNGAAVSMVYCLCVNWNNTLEAEGDATKNNPKFAFPFTVADYCEPDFLSDQADEGQRKRMKASATKALLWRMAGIDPDDGATQAQKQCLLRAVPVANGLMERIGDADNLSVTAKGNLRVPGHVMLEKPGADAKDSDIETYERNAAMPYTIDGSTGKNGNRTFAALQRAVAPAKNEGAAGQGKDAKRQESRLATIKSWIGGVNIGDPEQPDSRSGMDWVAVVCDLDHDDMLAVLLTGLAEFIGDDTAREDLDALLGVAAETQTA